MRAIPTHTVQSKLLHERHATVSSTGSACKSTHKQKPHRSKRHRDQFADLRLITAETLLQTASTIVTMMCPAAPGTTQPCVQPHTVWQLSSSASVSAPVVLQNTEPTLQALLKHCCTAIGIMHSAFPIKFRPFHERNSRTLAHLARYLERFGMDSSLLLNIPSRRPPPASREHGQKESSKRYRDYIKQCDRTVLASCVQIHITLQDSILWLDTPVMFDEKQTSAQLHHVLSRHKQEHPKLFAQIAAEADYFNRTDQPSAAIKRTPPASDVGGEVKSIQLPAAEALVPSLSPPSLEGASIASFLQSFISTCNHPKSHTCTDEGIDNRIRDEPLSEACLHSHGDWTQTQNIGAS